MKVSPVLLQMKFARIIDKYATKQGINLTEAMDLFYKSDLYQLLKDDTSDMHCRSEECLVKELEDEIKEKNNIVTEEVNYPKVIQVIPNRDYTVNVYFSDGKIVCYDVKPKLEKNMFKKLQDIDVFINTCTIMNDTLAWDIGGNRDETNCIDIDPYTLYLLQAVEEIKV